MKKNKLLRRLTAALLAAVLTLSIALPVFASDDSDTIYINSVSDLLSLAKSCAYDQWSVGKTVVLLPRGDVLGAHPVLQRTVQGQRTYHL